MKLIPLFLILADPLSARAEILSRRFDVPVTISFADRALSCTLRDYYPDSATARLKTANIDLSPIALHGHEFSIESEHDGPALCRKVKAFLAGTHGGGDLGRELFGTATTLLELRDNKLIENVDLTVRSSSDISQTLQFHSEVTQFLTP